MVAIAPNLTILVGELVGARLIAHAGQCFHTSEVISKGSVFKEVCLTRYGLSTSSVAPLLEEEEVQDLLRVVLTFIFWMEAY